LGVCPLGVTLKSNGNIKAYGLFSFVGGNASRTDTMKSILILILVISGLLFSCSIKELPKDLNESISYFEKHWSSGRLEDFKNKDEKKAVTELHMSVGMWIRNNWIHGNRNPQLVKFFDSLHFRHADDISSTILRSLHRKLNNKDIDLKGQIDYYEAYWKPIIEREEKLRNEVVDINKKFEVGDTLALIFPVDTSNNHRNAVGSHPGEWTFDKMKDLRLEGIVVRKFDIGGSRNPFIHYRLTEMSHPNTRVLMKSIAVGDTIELPLILVTIDSD
jgi:hypothetical protein